MLSIGKRVIIVADPQDASALRVFKRLENLGAPVQIVSTEQLVLAHRWVHDPLGESHIVLGNGSEIHSDDVTALFCRISFLDAPQFSAASARNQEYAAAEFHSLILSWLNHLGDRVHNRPHAAGLCGIGTPALEDHLRAARNGGICEPFAVTTHSRFISNKTGMLQAYQPQLHKDILTGAGQIEGESETALAGRPVVWALDPARHQRVRTLVIGRSTYCTTDNPNLQKVVKSEVTRQGLSLADVVCTETKPGEFGLCNIDPMPVLDFPEAVDAAAKLLIEPARQNRLQT